MAVLAWVLKLLASLKVFSWFWPALPRTWQEWLVLQRDKLESKDQLARQNRAFRQLVEELRVQLDLEVQTKTKYQCLQQVTERYYEVLPIVWTENGVG